MDDTKSSFKFETITTVFLVSSTSLCMLEITLVAMHDYYTYSEFKDIISKAIL